MRVTAVEHPGHSLPHLAGQLVIVGRSGPFSGRAVVAEPLRVVRPLRQVPVAVRIVPEPLPADGRPAAGLPAAGSGLY